MFWNESKDLRVSSPCPKRLGFGKGKGWGEKGVGRERETVSGLPFKYLCWLQEYLPPKLQEILQCDIGICNVFQLLKISLLSTQIHLPSTDENEKIKLK